MKLCCLSSYNFRLVNSILQVSVPSLKCRWHVQGDHASSQTTIPLFSDIAGDWRGAKKNRWLKVKLLAWNTFAWKLLACVTLHLEELLQSNPSTYKYLNSSQRWATRIGEKQLLSRWVKDGLVPSARGRATLSDAWRDSVSRGVHQQSFHHLPEGLTHTPPSAFRCGENGKT